MTLSTLLLVIPSLAALQVWSPEEKASAVVRPLVGLAIAFAIHRLVRRNPWPRPFRLRFLGLHVAAAAVAILTWLIMSALL